MHNKVCITAGTQVQNSHQAKAGSSWILKHGRSNLVFEGILYFFQYKGL